MGEVQIKPFKRVLVANRGEIAIRVYRALNELGITTVGIYSKEDRYALFRSKADESYQLKENKGPVDAYLTSRALLKLPRRQMLMLSIRAMVFSLRIRTLSRPAQKPASYLSDLPRTS